MKGHRLFFVGEYPARRAAPFFLGLHGDVFWFCEDDDRKFSNQRFNNHANKALLRKLFASVQAHGVINPVNLERRLWGGEIQDIGVHGGGRLWAARKLDIEIPAIIDVIDGEPPEDGMPVGDGWAGLYEGEHDARHFGDRIIFQQRNAGEFRA